MTPFQLFSPIHGLAAIASLISVFLAWRLGGMNLQPVTRQWVRRGSLALMIALYIAMNLYSVVYGEWSLRYNLPLHLCDLSVWIIVFALFYRSQIAFELGFYWGLTAGFMALIFPKLERTDAYLIMFFVWHAFLIAGPLYQMRADDLWPTRRGLFRSLGIAIVLGLVMMGLNPLLNSNYMFVNESISSFQAMGLPEWPGYLPWVIGLAMGLFWLALLFSRWLQAGAKFPVSPLTLGIALVWLANGLLCKVLNLVPRHQEIVARILGEDLAPILTPAIGAGEILMAVWVLSRKQPAWCAYTQIGLVATMNTIEAILAPDLLLWGRWNAAFAALFIVVVYFWGRQSQKQ